MRVLFLFLMLQVGSVFGQINSIPIRFTWGNELVQLEKNYYCSSIQDSLALKELKGYITHLKGYVHGKEILLKESYLFSLDSPQNCSLVWKKKLNLDSISFTLGVDSITNISGAMGGDLDPMYGMYWTWQSGYIHFKVEGYSKACSSPKHEFQYHLGGYSFPYHSSRRLRFPINQSSPILEIKIDEWFQGISLKELDHVMSPSENSVQWMTLLSECIQLK